MSFRSKGPRILMGNNPYRECKGRNNEMQGKEDQQYPD